MGRRNSLDIIAGIVSTTLEPTKKTRIMYRNNLSWKSLCKYLSEVTAAGLVNLIEKDGNYITTQKGENFLKKYEPYRKGKKTVKGDEKTILEKMLEPVKVD